MRQLSWHFVGLGGGLSLLTPHKKGIPILYRLIFEKNLFLHFFFKMFGGYKITTYICIRNQGLTACSRIENEARLQ